MSKSLRLALLAICTLTTFQTIAQTQYVTDKLGITMRRGESVEYGILRSLPSGTSLNVLNTNPETGYSKVELADGTQGYVLSRFLLDTPAAREQLVQANTKLEKLQVSNKSLQSNNQELKATLKETQKTLAQVQANNSSLSEKLKSVETVAAKPLEIQQQNQVLNTRNERLQNELTKLKASESALQHDKTLQWFIAGSVITLFSLFLGVILPRLNFRRRQSWGY